MNLLVRELEMRGFAQSFMRWAVANKGAFSILQGMSYQVCLEGSTIGVIQRNQDFLNVETPNGKRVLQFMPHASTNAHESHVVFIVHGKNSGLTIPDYDWSIKNNVKCTRIPSGNSWMWILLTSFKWDRRDEDTVVKAFESCYELLVEWLTLPFDEDMEFMDPYEVSSHVGLIPVNKADDGMMDGVHDIEWI